MTKYYLTFRDADGKTFAGDRSPLYEIAGFNLSTIEKLKSGVQTTNAGKVSGNTFTFNLRSNQLSRMLDQWLTSDARLKQIMLVGLDTDANGKSVQSVREALNVTSLKSTAINTTDWIHNITVQLGDVTESAAPKPSLAKLDLRTLGDAIREDSVAGAIVTSALHNLIPASPPALDPAKASAPPGAISNVIYARLLDADGQVVGSGWIELESRLSDFNQTLSGGSEISSAGEATLSPPTPIFAPVTIEFSQQQSELAGQDLEKITFSIQREVGVDPLLTRNLRYGAAAIASSAKRAANAEIVNFTVRYGSEQIAADSNGLSTSGRTEWNGTPLAAQTNLASGFKPITPLTAREGIAPTIKPEGASVACFSGGTHLLTEHGLAAVEALRIGDRLLTLSGEHQSIVQIRRRRYVCGGHPNPEQVWPVVIAAGAFGEGSPGRDLVLNPGHPLYVDGRLAPAIRLVNGATIRQAPIAEVDYWRIDLPAHAVVYAEGLLSGSYVDTESRLNFEGDDKMVQNPDFGPQSWDETCAPHLDDAALPPLRQRLLRRAEDFGFSFESDTDLHAIADGRRIEPVKLDENRFAFVFPPSVANALLASRSWRPLEATADNPDPRTLGVCLCRLEVDGSVVDLADETLTEGWHAYEPDDRQRWTNGRASLPSGLRIALLDLCGVGRYLRRPRPFALEA